MIKYIYTIAIGDLQKQSETLYDTLALAEVDLVAELADLYPGQTERRSVGQYEFTPEYEGDPFSWHTLAGWVSRVSSVPDSYHVSDELLEDLITLAQGGDLALWRYPLAVPSALRQLQRLRENPTYIWRVRLIKCEDE